MTGTQQGIAWLSTIVAILGIACVALWLALIRYQNRDERQRQQIAELHKRLIYAEARFDRAAQRQPRVNDWVD